MVYELSHRHPQTRSDFWGHSSANYDSLKSLYWTKAITSQGNLSVAEAEAAFLVQKRAEIQTSPQILAFFCRVTKASSLFTNTYLYLRDIQRVGRKKMCIYCLRNRLPSDVSLEGWWFFKTIHYLLHLHFQVAKLLLQRQCVKVHGFLYKTHPFVVLVHYLLPLTENVKPTHRSPFI